MHTVIETPAFLRQAQLEGMSDAERGRAVSIIAANPAAGALIRGSGGCRKVRVPREGAGKSGGYRVVTYFATGRAPVFLVAVLSKTSRDNFSDKEVQAMAAMSKGLIAGLGPRAIDPEEDGDD